MTAVVTFLRAFYAAFQVGVLVVWRKTTKATKAFDISALDEASKYVTATGKVDDVYFGVGLQRSIPATGRGKATDVVGIPGLWLDIDMMSPGAHASAKLPATDQDVDALYVGLPWPPTVVVDSGHGRHAYWLFSSPWVFASDAERERAATLVQRFQARIRENAVARGWDLDSTHDLARVLRIPGTTNHKNGKQRQVRLLVLKEDARVTPEEVESWLKTQDLGAAPAAVMSAVPKKTPALARASATHGARELPPSGTADFEAIRANCGWVRACVESRATLGEPQWYGLLSIVVRCSNADNLVHEVSAGHPGYDPASVQEKAQHAATAAGPRTCAGIAADLGGEQHCSVCRFSGNVSSPVVIGLRAARDHETARARKLVEQTVGAIVSTKNAGLAFDATVLSSLALVRQRDRRAYVELRSAIKAARVPMAELDDALRSHGRATFDKDVLVGDAVPDAPRPELMVPEGFELTEQSVDRVAWQDGNRETRPITGAAIIISGRLREVDSSAEEVEVSWRGAGGWRSYIVSRERVLDGRKLVELSKHGFPVASDNAAHLVAYLRRFDEVNAGAIPTVKVARSLGWVPSDGGFLVGDEYIPSDGSQGLAVPRRASPFAAGAAPVVYRPEDGADEATPALRRAGSLDGWRNAVASLKDFAVAQLALYLGLASVILEIVECPNFIVDFSGPSSRGKSTVQRVSASPWGDPTDGAVSPFILSWNSTLPFIERIAAARPHFPLILDDTKSGDPEAIAQIVYNFCQGRGRGRASKTGLQAVLHWRGLLISSGERTIASFGRNGGLGARCITLLEPPFGTGDKKAVVDALTRGLSTNYGHAGPAFVRFIASHRDRWPGWAEAAAVAAARYASTAAGPLSSRLARYAGAIDIAGRLAHDALDLPWPYNDPLAEIWPRITQRADAADVAEAALGHLLSWAVGNQASFEGRVSPGPYGDKDPREWAGRWDQGDWKWVGFHQHVLERVLQAGGYEAAEVIPTWRERGVLIVDGEGGRHTKKARVGRESTRLVAISRYAYEKVYGDAADAEEPPPGNGDGNTQDPTFLDENDELWT